MTPQEVINKTRPRNPQGGLLKMALEAYTDGSCLQNNIAKIRHVMAGYSFTVRNPDGSTRYEQFGPVITKEEPMGDESSPRFHGALRGTNQTGELTALLELLEWLLEFGPNAETTPQSQLTDEGKPRILIHPDSRYAQHQAMSLWEVNENYELIYALRKA